MFIDVRLELYRLTLSRDLSIVPLTYSTPWTK
jgi:hypothetical protein